MQVGWYSADLLDADSYGALGEELLSQFGRGLQEHDPAQGIAFLVGECLQGMGGHPFDQPEVLLHGLPEGRAGEERFPAGGFHGGIEAHERVRLAIGRAEDVGIGPVDEDRVALEDACDSQEKNVFRGVNHVQDHSGLRGIGQGLQSHGDVLPGADEAGEV